MNKGELYEKIMAMVPVKNEEEKDFRGNVSEKLRSYVSSVEQLDSNERPEDWDAIITRIEQLCKGINRAIYSEYKGMRHSAYTTIKNQLNGYIAKNIEIVGLALNNNIHTVEIGTVSYRMRKVSLEEQHNLKAKDMFHIPLNKKGIVETQRYSVPGYPCLYLARNVYGCWEEMGRPNFGTVMVSKFETQREFKMLDLRVPTRDTWENNIKNCLQIFPLVIASMIQVKNSKDTYKPEYLIPQLLTEWIISENENNKGGDKILGIMYTSAHKNNDFSFPDNSYDNYAIPVLNPLCGKQYCKELTNYFKLTAPTYYDLEVLKLGESIDRGYTDATTEEEKRINKLRISPFGFMEEYLRERELENLIQ